MVQRRSHAAIPGSISTRVRIFNVSLWLELGGGRSKRTSIASFDLKIDRLNHKFFRCILVVKTYIGIYTLIMIRPLDKDFNLAAPLMMGIS